MILKYLFGLSFFFLFVKCEEVIEESNEKWDNFKIKWTYPGLTPVGFLDQPQTQAEAVSKNWKQVSDGKRGCSKENIYPGFHFIPPKENPEFTLIYDINGYIAGMQSLVSKTADTSHYDFETANWYDEDVIKGDAVYLATVYFIKPDMICSTGRSQKEFDDQGIGNILWFRNKDGTFIKAPLKMDDADDDCFWKRHKSFVNMGTHYFNLDYGNKTDCKKDMPLMLLYIDNNLNGFAWQHMAPLNTTGTDWEIFSIQALKMAVREPADCIVELAKTENLRTMHVFFRDYQISGEKCQKLNEKDVPIKDLCKDNGTGQSISVGIMSALSWLLIYNI